jgi:hypothetical protein
MSHVFTVHDARGPSHPTAGNVTYIEAKGEPEEPPKMPERDYDCERSAAALTFDVPDLPRKNKTREPEVEAEMTDGLRIFLLGAALCNLATIRYDEDDKT